MRVARSCLREGGDESNGSSNQVQTEIDRVMERVIGSLRRIGD